MKAGGGGVAIGRPLVCAASLLGVVGVGPAALGQATAAPEIALASGQTLTLHLQPRQYQSIRVGLRADRYNEVRVALVDRGVKGSYIKVAPQEAKAPAEPVISDSGEPFVRVEYGPGAPPSALLQVTALTNSKADTAPVDAEISVTASEPSAEKTLYSRALTAFNHGELLRRTRRGGKEALASYMEAVEDAKQLRDAVLEQRALLSAGRMLMLDGKDYAQAVELERRAVAVKGTEEAPGVEAMAWKMLGGALLNTAEYDESVKASKYALSLYERTGDVFWQGVVLENIGSAYLNLGRLDEALAFDERALEISRRLHDDFGVVEMLTEIGAIDESRGEYQAALNCFAEAVEVKLPSTYNPMQGEAWGSMGKLHMELGEETHASDDFRRELDIAQHTENGLDELDALYNAGRVALERGDWKPAQTLFTQGLTRSRELKLVRPQSALLVGLARTEIALAQTEKAKPLLVEAVAVSSGIHQGGETAAAHSVMGEIDERAGEMAEAQSEFAQAAALYAAIPDKAGLAEADASLARVENAQGHAEAAVGHLNAAMDIVESSRASFAQGNLRTRYFARQRGVYDRAITLLMQMERAGPGQGFAAQAWTVAERARARSLLDELSSTGATEGSSSAKPLLSRLAALQVQIHDLEEQLAQTGTSAADMESAARTQGKLRAAVLSADEVEARLRGAQTSPVLDPKSISPQTLASAAMSKDDALIEYWVGRDATYAWVVSADGKCAGFLLAETKALPRLTQEYRSKLLARDVGVSTETMQQHDTRVARADAEALGLAVQLGKTLLPQALLEKLHGVRRLMIVPDGALAQVPFASLRVAGAMGHSNDYLVQRYELLSEPSAAFLMLRNRAPAAAKTNSVVVFADPVYNLADSRVRLRPGSANLTLQSSATGGPPRDLGMMDLARLARLPGSRREALEIADIAQTQTRLRLGFAATPAAVLATDWSKVAVAHFAAHAIAQPAGRNVSGIVLSIFDERGRRQDGVLWLRDIYSARISPDLVVLSGCGTALGETTPGEGVDSLLRAFLVSGARQVGATLWSADDASAEALMGRFYRDLIGRGMDAPQALRDAQLALKSQPRYAAPYYWAGFVMEGRWKTR